MTNLRQEANNPIWHSFLKSFPCIGFIERHIAATYSSSLKWYLYTLIFCATGLKYNFSRIDRSLCLNFLSWKVFFSILKKPRLVKTKSASVEKLTLLKHLCNGKETNKYEFHVLLRSDLFYLEFNFENFRAGRTNFARINFFARSFYKKVFLYSLDEMKREGHLG